MWTQEQLNEYAETGFLFLPGLLTSEETFELNDAVALLMDGKDEEDFMHREREKTGAVRQVFLAHRYNPAFKKLIKHPKILEPVNQILNNDVYIWHSKLNAKDAFEGAVWLWHQDYGYWMWDGVDPKLVSVMIFLDEATINNGCLMVISGSHHWGRQEHYADTVTTSYKQWCIDRETLMQKVKEDNIRQITGVPGDVLFFDCNIAHGSSHNMSPLPRKSFIISYNSIDNKPRAVDNPRPDWVVARQFDIVK